MQPSNTNELQAINTMLSTIGEAPVDSLTGATSSDAALADQVLTEVARETLVQGWYFNLDKKDWLYRDGFGNIFLPANTARVEINRNKYPTIEPVLRPQAPPVRRHAATVRPGQPDVPVQHRPPGRQDRLVLGLDCVGEIRPLLTHTGQSVS